VSLEELWQQKSDQELEVASKEISDYTEEAEQVIRSELRRRGFPKPPKAKRVFKVDRDSEHHKKVRQAEEELDRRIEETFALTNKEYRFRLFGLLVIAPIILGTFLCQIYGVVIGSLIIWSGISSAFRGQASFTYIAGAFNPLPLFQFNSGLGNFCFGWGVLCSVIIGWGKRRGAEVYLLTAAVFGIANLIVGLMNLFRMQSVLSIHIPGLSGFIISIYIGLSTVITILLPLKNKSNA
jgi:hypothetical protein